MTIEYYNLKTKKLENVEMDSKYPSISEKGKRVRTFKGLDILIAEGKFGSIKTGYSNRVGYQRTELSENIAREGDY